ncbi:uncharacterized protein TNCV_4047051 [Trichonephila clavipes]|nr:uncharacterized protein TNCV_4047051 [Trichonephila clavipes]
MPRRRIRDHYEQLSEFERRRIIERSIVLPLVLKEAGCVNRRIVRHMGRSDAAIRRCWQEWADMFSDESRFQLSPDDHRRRVWKRPGQRADPVFTVECHTGHQQEVMFFAPLSLLRPRLARHVPTGESGPDRNNTNVQDYSPNFPSYFVCVVFAELETMCIVSYNVVNTAAIVQYCKILYKNIATIARTGIAAREGRHFTKTY